MPIPSKEVCGTRALHHLQGVAEGLRLLNNEIYNGEVISEEVLELLTGVSQEMFFVLEFVALGLGKRVPGGSA